MYCKFCGKQLEDGQTVCSGCGQDNAENKSGFAGNPGKIALTIGAVVLLVGVLAAVIFSGLKTGQTPVETTAPTSEAVEETAAATVPADTGLNDATCKGTYTVSDEEVVAEMDTVVATSGDFQLTNAQLQVFYWLQVQDFLSSDYGYYAYYLGMDYTQPLDTQSCMFAEGLTWQQYFLEGALEAWHSYQAMAAEAAAANYEMDAELREYLDTLPASLEESAAAYGFDTVEELLAYNVGAGCTVEDYVHFWNLYYEGYTYYSAMYDSIIPTDEEIEAYFDENAETYAEEGVTKDTRTIDVRHILIMPEGGTYDATTYTTTYSDEEWAAAYAEAEAILNEWLSGDKTEDSFAQLANTHSDDSDGTDGGLYTDVTEGYMVEAFNDWCFDEIRVVGDYGLVQTEYGWHVMYFSGSGYLWESYALTDLINERSTAMLEEIIAKYPMEVDYSAIKLGYVDMAS